MARTDWTGDTTLAAFDDGHEEGTRGAAQELMDAIRANGVTDHTWADIDLVEVVTQWLDNHGIDLHTPAFKPGQAIEYQSFAPGGYSAGQVTRYAGEMTEPGVIA